MEKDMEKILKLIEAGDQDVILDKKETVSQLEILIKNQMVCLEDRKLILTRKGTVALNKSMEAHLMDDSSNGSPVSRDFAKMTDYLKNWDRKRKISITIWILLLLIAIILRYWVS